MRFLLILLLISFEIHAFTVTSINLQWFGRGGILEGTVEDEYRGNRVKDFLFNQLPESDVYVFQEVTAPELIEKIFKELTCESYINEVDRHQYVVTCHKKTIQSYAEVNYEVKLGNPQMRAALISNLELEDERKVKVIGLHLKAGRDKTNFRKQQLIKLEEDIFENLPMVIIGDFNAFPKSRTLLENDDAFFFDEILNPFGFVKSPIQDKTLLWSETRIFDLAWYKNLILRDAKVFGPCSFGSVEYPYSNFDFYRRFISDHCAIQVSFE